MKRHVVTGEHRPRGARLVPVIDDIEVPISQIRTTIHALREVDPRDSGAVGRQFIEVIAEHTSKFDFSPRLRFDGPSERVVPADWSMLYEQGCGGR